MPGLDKETKQFLLDARNLGGKGRPIRLSNNNLMRLCARIAADVRRMDLWEAMVGQEEPPESYYKTPFAWFDDPLPGSPDLVSCFTRFDSEIEDFRTYFGCLCKLHKRRLKFHQILRQQDFAKVEQIVPRCLLEFGDKSGEALASWLVWRKWMYDIDNRSAQETGYLFEPILTAALGGKSYAAKISVIKRTGDPTKGRQVDCIVEDETTEEKYAYEFKLRVTIAASGQGRFAEELGFALDCKNSGYKPVLIVLDSTPSPRLTDYVKAFNQQGGDTYIGERAWQHLEDKAGPVMADFLEKYVRGPLHEIQSAKLDLNNVWLKMEGDFLRVTVDGGTFLIDRSGPKMDIEGTDAEEDAMPSEEES